MTIFFIILASWLGLGLLNISILRVIHHYYENSSVKNPPEFFQGDGFDCTVSILLSPLFLLCLVGWLGINLCRLISLSPLDRPFKNLGDKIYRRLN